MVTHAKQEPLDEHPAPGSNWRRIPAKLAAAALMVECARIDGELDEEERGAICRVVREEFKLDEEAAESLVDAAEMREDEVWGDWGFTETVKTHFDVNGRLAVIRKLWDVAFVDGIVHPLEERLIARIGRDLDISDQAAAVIALYHRLRRPLHTGSEPSS